ncbi:efflux RND transporter periplasmic adaptor subunit [Candidatus Gottesmanbacteria bacterium]|nr:efflux RND transporter periplasmic adaptor subunit [Candidatus Gottesmanbacteria bacterium]
MTTKRRIAALALAGALAAGGGGIAYQKQQANVTKSSVKTAVVRRTMFEKTITSSGKTKAKKSVELKFQTSGRLTWVGVKEGDTVQQYQAIAKLDVREVQKNLENELRDYAKQRNDFEEMWRVTYKGIKDPSDALTDTVKRILEKNQWDLEKAVLDVEIEHLSVEFATLVSPIAGIVTRVDMPVAGVNITPATAVFEIVDPDSLVFEASVDEVDVATIAIGRKTTVTLDAYPSDPFTGSVTKIAFAAKTSSGGATVFPVEVAIATSSAVRVGMNGDVAITVDTQGDALVIPAEAVQEAEKGSFVYRKEGKTYKKTPIEVGARNDEEVVVQSGLTEGDEVVVKGFKDLPK